MTYVQSNPEFVEQYSALLQEMSWCAFGNNLFLETMLITISYMEGSWDFYDLTYVDDHNRHPRSIFNIIEWVKIVMEAA